MSAATLETAHDWLADKDQTAGALNKVSKYVLVPHKGQLEVIESKARFRVVRAGRRFGKGLKHGTGVLRPDGAWTPIEDLSENDMVVGSDGKPVKVTGVFPRGKLPMVTVTLKNGQEIVCDYEHLWGVRRRFRKGRANPVEALSVAAMLSEGVTVDRPDGLVERRFTIPVGSPVELPEKTYALDPYALGALLGDGALGNHPVLHSADPEIFDYVRETGLDVRVLKIKDGHCPAVSVCGITPWIRDNGLRCRSEHKHVPEEYLRGSIEQRLDLLRGLMDTDGWLEGPGRLCAFASASEQLTLAVRELAASLGGKVNKVSRKETTHLDSHAIRFYMPKGLNPFRLRRKAERWQPTPTERLGQQIVSIEPAGDHEDTCISVAAEDGLFVTEGYTLTHNTKVSARILIQKALEQPGMLGWWVAPEYKNIKRGYTEVVSQIPPEMLAYTAPPSTSQNLVLTFKNGSSLEFYSGKNPDALAGAGVDFAVIDEAALVPHGAEVWNQLIRPTLMDRGGGALFISTPRGKNWFWELDKRGHSGAYVNKDWESFHFTSLDNPTIPDIASEVSEARDIMPDILFRQEIMAEFLSSAASIFNLEHPDAIVPHLADVRGSVFMGIDLAQKQDFTVLTASRVGDRMPVYHRRFNSLRWADQREIIRGAVEELEDLGAEEVRVGIDATGVGSAVVEELENEGMDLERIMFTNKWKEEAVGVLSRDLQNGDAHILDDQREEFEHYEYELTPAGNYKFESSVGHDDEVSAKLIENWLHHKMGPAEVKVIRHEEDRIRDTGLPEGQRAGEPDSPSKIANNPESWGGPGSASRSRGFTR